MRSVHILYILLYQLLSGGWVNSFLKAARCLGPVKRFKIFNISIHISKALKRQNFQDHLDFKGKLMAKFLLRSHFLSLYKNMTIKQQISHGSIHKKYVTCIMPFLIPFAYITLCQFYLPCVSLFTKNNKLWNERKKRFFVYMAASAYHVMLKEVEILHL